MEYIGKKLKLKEIPELYYGNPNVTIGNEYLIVDIDGSNFWLIDDSGDKVTFGMCRFILQ